MARQHPSQAKEGSFARLLRLILLFLLRYIIDVYDARAATVRRCPRVRVRLRLVATNVNMSIAFASVIYRFRRSRRRRRRAVPLSPPLLSFPTLTFQLHVFAARTPARSVARSSASSLQRPTRSRNKTSLLSFASFSLSLSPSLFHPSFL